MRKKPNLIPRLSACSELELKTPSLFRGRWLERFDGFSELVVELGCGKGRYTADFAALHPNSLVVAIERVPEAIVVAMERVLEASLSNVRFVIGDAMLLSEMFARGEVSRFIINFCDPWPKNRDVAKRLTAPRFLNKYAELLTVGGDLWFKTDNAPLFDWSVRQLEACGFAISGLTHNLHEHEAVYPMTDYEQKFYADGLPICRLVATARRRDDAPLD